MYEGSRGISKLLILIILPGVASKDFILARDANNYGPYNIRWENYRACRGPKQMNLTDFQTSITLVDGAYMGEFNITFLKVSRIDEIKIHVANAKGNQKTTLWSYFIDKPCQHFAIASLMQKYLEVHNCIVQKGNYYFLGNYTEVAYNFFGTSFFYGEYSFKVNVISKAGNLACLAYNAVFSKKKS